MISEGREPVKLPCEGCQTETFWRLSPTMGPFCQRCYQKTKQDSLQEKQLAREEDLRDL